MQKIMTLAGVCLALSIGSMSPGARRLLHSAQHSLEFKALGVLP